MKISLATFENFSDRELYDLCKEYSGNAKIWLKKFGGLLPEVFERKMYKKYGFTSIYEFAKKLAGMNERTVYKILCLSRRLAETPGLLNLLKSGEVGWSKIEKVASISNIKNEKILIEKVRNLSKNLLEAYVRNVKSFTPGSKIELENNLGTRQGHELSLVTNGVTEEDGENPNKLYLSTYKKFIFSISKKTENKLRYVKINLDKKFGRLLTWNETFYFWPYEANLKEKVIINLCPDCVKRKGQESKKRSIPKDVRRILVIKYNNHCAFPACNKAIADFHHTKRFSLHKNHDPEYIVPLCKHHHDLIHAGLIANEQEAVEKWHVGENTNLDRSKTVIDRKVQKYKNFNT